MHEHNCLVYCKMSFPSPTLINTFVINDQAYDLRIALFHHQKNSELGNNFDGCILEKLIFRSELMTNVWNNQSESQKFKVYMEAQDIRKSWASQPDLSMHASLSIPRECCEVWLVQHTTKQSSKFCWNTKAWCVRLSERHSWGATVASNATSNAYHRLVAGGASV